MRLAGKVALVTGAASGIGAAIARRFAAEGAIVHAADLADGGGLLRLDVTREEDWQAAMARIASDHGRLDVLVNNAGIVSNLAIDAMTLAMWNRVMAVNVTGAMLGCRAAIALMCDRDAGSSASIINIASTTSFLGLANDVVYTASKAAVVGLTKSVATWCALQGLPIRVNTLHPGATLTAILRDHIAARPEMKAAFDRMAPIGRMADPDEQAALAVFLASDDSSYSTGAAFVADGGLTAAHPTM
jgi:NAD(P)-dependent dehydrogenase (short-subunit alcohol dehydrogenase family)